MARCAAESNTRDFPQLTVSAKLVVTAYDSEENVCNRSQFQLYLYLALDPDRDPNEVHAERICKQGVIW